MFNIPPPLPNMNTMVFDFDIHLHQYFCGGRGGVLDFFSVPFIPTSYFSVLVREYIGSCPCAAKDRRGLGGELERRESTSQTLINPDSVQAE